MSSTEKFSFDTIKDFDNHIAKSIPNYHSLFESIISIAPYFLKSGTGLCDLGCSTGELLNSIEHPGGFKRGYDISAHLLPKPPFPRNTLFIQCDLTNPSKFLLPPSSLILSIFTLQFIDKEKRLDILKAVHDALTPGGVFIWAEKVLSPNAFWEDMLSSAYYEFKRKSFSSDEILDKEKDLRSIMHPNTTKENDSLLLLAGFSSYEIVWKNFNFECYLVTR